MSWRHAAAVATTTATPARRLRRPGRPKICLVLNGRYLSRADPFEELAGLLQVEFLVCRLDAEKEAIAAGQREALGVEDRMIRLRQTIERQHAEHARQRGAENRALIGDRDERRPAVERLAADVQRIRDDRNPVLEQK